MKVKRRQWIEALIIWNKELRENEALRNQESRAQGLVCAKELGVDGEEALLGICADPQQGAERRSTACVALGFLKHGPALPILLELADDSDLLLACNALHALERIRNSLSFWPVLSLAKNATRVTVRVYAVYVLGSLSDQRAEETLMNILRGKTEDGYLRCCAASALGLLPKHSVAAVRCLLDAVNDPSPILRWTVLNELGMSGNRRVVPAIRAALTDKTIVIDLPGKVTVSNAARNALRNLYGQ